MSSEPEARPHPEPVVLNIGGTVGALVVHWGPDEIDTPIEISPTGADEDREHQHVLERPLPDQTFHAAVFDVVEQGSYTLWVRGEARERDVVITGGQVTELRWTAPAT